MLYNLLQNIEFKYEWVLPLLLSLPVIAWFYYRTPRFRKASFRVTSAEKFRVKTFRTALVHLPFWLRLLAIGCVIVALARPQVKNTQSKNRGEGIDIVLCMDVSGSMLAQDFYPTRLDVSKTMAEEFVKQRPIDQIGLVIFSGESFTQFPVSSDHAALLEQIRGIRSGMLIDGTVIGEGLATSVERLTSSKAKSKVIILLTDGNEQPPETRLVDPLTALEIAKAKGVKVYTIGMGTLKEAAPLVKGASRERQSGYLDEGLLKKIASQTGGAYFRAIDKESLRHVYRQIDRLEKSEVEVVTKTRYAEYFIYFIMAALFLLGLDLILRYTSLRTFP
jgi:Ca-activated chloride channel family protein